jgi:protein arginine N-methyltransferase 1
MYALNDYAAMVADPARMRAYAGALAEVVRPGSVVVDIGAGFGILALMACKLGARRVYAIDPSPCVEVGRELARENGFEDRIAFFQADSRSVDLPERAQVIVSDLRGGLPLSRDHLEVIADARLRFLADGGTLLPQRDVMWAAIASLPKPYAAHFGPAVGPHGVTLGASRRRLVNIPISESDSGWDPELLVEPRAWGELDYEVLVPRPFAARLDWPVVRAGTGHGVLLWFEATIRPGWQYATGPRRAGDESRAYSRLLLPFEQPLSLAEGDRIHLDLWMGPRGEPISWAGAALAADGAEKARWRLSTFYAALNAPVRVDPLVGHAQNRSA